MTARVRTQPTVGRLAAGLYVVQYDAAGQVVKVPTRRGESVQIGVPVPKAAAQFRQVVRTFATQPRTATVEVYGNIYKSAGRFEVDDVRLEPLDAPPTRFEGQVAATDDGLAFEAHAPGLDLKLAATLRAHARHIRVDGVVRDTTGRDRPLRVAFHLPLDARGWTWWDDIAESRTTFWGRAPYW